MKLEDIKVYDPKRDGLDFETYSNAYKAAEAVNRNAAYAMHDGLVRKVQKSPVGDTGITLADFLSPEDGFFSLNTGVLAVVFMDGKFHSKYNREEFKSLDVDELAKTKWRVSKAIPRNSAFASSRSCPRIAVSARTVTTLGWTSSMPPATKISSSGAPLPGWMRTAPGLMRVISGVCRG